MRRPRAVLALVSALAATAALAGCSGDGLDPGPQPSDPGPASTYVSVGASDAVGVGADRPTIESWPQVLYRTALPRATVFVNTAVDGATVADALDSQVDLALSLDPDLVTVSLGVNDLRAGVPVDTYQAQLDELVGRLRRGGATRVLVANLAPLDQLPAYVAGAGTTFPPVDQVLALLDAYDEAVAAVVAGQGAELVDLHAVGLAARAEGVEGSLVSGDGFHPSTAGHARIAAAFAAAL